MTSLNVDDFLSQNRDFFEYMLNWYNSLPVVHLDELTDSGQHPERLAILSEDLIKCFTTRGTLASERVLSVLPAVVRLFEAAHAAGVKDFLLAQDSHPEDSMQFEAFGEHCVSGSVDAETVDELANLPFADQFTVLLKESLNPAIGTALEDWFRERKNVKNVIVVGDCTDLCVYQVAMHLKSWSHVEHRRLNVIIPEDCVQTYDLPIAAARDIAAMPHNGDVLHVIFLYHMALSGIRVVKHVET